MTQYEYVVKHHRSSRIAIWRDMQDYYSKLKNRNIILAYLWHFASVILYCILSIFAGFNFVIELFQDSQYSLHFMEFYIKDRNLDTAEARNYLLQQYASYQRMLATNCVYSEQKRQKIIHAFNYLFEQYPEEENVFDDKAEIKNDLSKITEATQKIHSNVKESSLKLDTIKDYTDTKQKEDQERKIFEAEQVAKAEQRKKSAYRKAEPVPTSFYPKLSDTQLDIFTDYCNKLRVFKRDVSSTELKEVFLCIHKTPIQLRHNKLLSLMLNNLSDYGFISEKWQRISGKYNCFTSKNGKQINARDLSSAKLKGDVIKSHDEELIDECILKIKSAR